MNNKLAFESLVMDLKRVAIGYHRNSLGMAKRFYEEALKRRNEIDPMSCKPYIQRVLQHIDSLQHMPQEEIAEETLMLSILLQNYTQTL